MRPVAYPLAAHGYLGRIASSPPPAATAPAPPPCAEILGIPLAISDYEEVMDWMEALIAADGRGYVTAAAVNLVMKAQEEPATLRRRSAPRSRSPTASRWCGRCTRSDTPAPPASTAPT